MAIERNEHWVNFINLYKSLPELWDVKSDKYKNKIIRAAAFEKLVIEYKNIDVNASIEKVKNRIRNMRISYRRELKKKLRSEKSGAGVDDLYEPNLWYFNEFNFLKEFELPEDGKSTMCSSDEERTSPTSAKVVKRKIISGNHERNELLKKATMQMEALSKTQEKDEAAIFAEGWAFLYRKLDNTQKLYAKRACDEIFVLGQLGKLTLNTVRTETPSYPPSHRVRSSSCSSVPQIISVHDVTNGQSTPILINSDLAQTYSGEETPISQGSEYSSFTDLFSDNSYS